VEGEKGDTGKLSVQHMPLHLDLSDVAHSPLCHICRRRRRRHTMTTLIFSLPSRRVAHIHSILQRLDLFVGMLHLPRTRRVELFVSLGVRLHRCFDGRK
jgi:hypothetical protein